MPNKKLWGYISKLEKVIKETMESSAEIAELVEKIQREGIEVSLNCIALFSDPRGKSFTGRQTLEGMEKAGLAEPKKKGTARGGRKRKAEGAEPGKKPKRAAKKKVAPDLNVTDADREFLRRIGIRYD